MTASDVRTAVLHRKLTEHMDTETADTLLERLPPDWEQIATKSDLLAMRADLKGLSTEMDALESKLVTKMEAMESRINRRAADDLKVVLFTIVGFALAIVGMFVTILVSGVPAAG